MKIAVFGNTYRSEILNHVRILVEFLVERNVDTLFDELLYQYVADNSNCPLDGVEPLYGNDYTADLALSIGGDGTFLYTATRIGSKQIPILGINIGRLGFLADVATGNLLEAMEAVLNQQYEVEDRTVLHITASDNTLFDYPYALNELSVSKQDSSSMISITASVNGQMVHTYQADGLIISTPTGSTAYSMSVGGPLVVPQAQSFILSPVASHSLNVRPLIIPDSWVIDLQVDSRSGCYLVSIDGRSKILEQSTRLHVSKADYTVKIVKQLNHTFFDTLKNKLMWGVDSRV